MRTLASVGETPETGSMSPPMAKCEAWASLNVIGDRLVLAQPAIQPRSAQSIPDKNKETRKIERIKFPNEEQRTAIIGKASQILQTRAKEHRPAVHFQVSSCSGTCERAVSRIDRTIRP